MSFYFHIVKKFYILNICASWPSGFCPVFSQVQEMGHQWGWEDHPFVGVGHPFEVVAHPFEGVVAEDFGDLAEAEVDFLAGELLSFD